MDAPRVRNRTFLYSRLVHKASCLIAVCFELAVTSSTCLAMRGFGDVDGVTDGPTPLECIMVPRQGTTVVQCSRVSAGHDTLFRAMPAGGPW